MKEGPSICCAWCGSLVKESVPDLFMDVKIQSVDDQKIGEFVEGV